MIGTLVRVNGSNKRWASGDDVASYGHRWVIETIFFVQMHTPFKDPTTRWIGDGAFSGFFSSIDDSCPSCCLLGVSIGLLLGGV